MRRALPLLLVFAVRPAGADVWGPPRAVSPQRQSVVEEANHHLAEARHFTIMAGGGRRNLSPQATEHARAALRDYERALGARGPDDAELHYRALVAASFYIEARDGYEAVVRHADALRASDPLDPREAEVTWDVCIALSKLGARGGPEADVVFERALKEYDHWRHMTDEANPDRADTVAISYANAAELRMAVGKLDESIHDYRESVELNSVESLAFYGLAVAYDRDGQVNNAREAMRQALIRDPQLKRPEDENVFFVPEGDVYYYFALAHEVRGDRELALSEYQKFLTLASNTRYAARAREHIAELTGGAGAH